MLWGEPLEYKFPVRKSLIIAISVFRVSILDLISTSPIWYCCPSYTATPFFTEAPIIKSFGLPINSASISSPALIFSVVTPRASRSAPITFRFKPYLEFVESRSIAVWEVKFRLLSLKLRFMLPFPLRIFPLRSSFEKS